MKTIRETSRAVAIKLIQLARITPWLKVLEPSAGEGKIIDVLNELYPNAELKVECIELTEDKYQILKDKGHNAFHKDFLQFTPNHLYDRIIACPPFKNNIDTAHIMKMYTHLEESGILVSLTSPLWILNNEPHQVEFRKWLETKKYTMQMLPEDSFVEKNKSVPTMVLQIFRD